MGKLNKRKPDFSNPPETLDDILFFGIELDEEQKILRDEIDNPDRKIIFVNAKAGTGKTFISVATSALMYRYGMYNGLTYVVNAYGESKQGFLPGDITEKSAVYFEPLYQALLSCKEVPEQSIKTSPMTEVDKEGSKWVTAITNTFLRGSNIENQIVIIDEAQNYDIESLKKTLTRIHDSCKVLVIGHSAQCDLDNKSKSGFDRYIQWFLSQNDDRAVECKLTTNHRGWIATVADDLIE